MPAINIGEISEYGHDVNDFHFQHRGFKLTQENDLINTGNVIAPFSAPFPPDYSCLRLTRQFEQVNLKIKANQTLAVSVCLTNLRSGIDLGKPDIPKQPVNHSDAPKSITQEASTLLVRV